VRAGSDALAVLAEDDAAHAIGVPDELGLQLTALDGPDLHPLVARGAGEELAVRTEGNAQDAGLVSGKRPHQLAALGLPELDVAARAVGLNPGRGEVFSVRAERQVAHRAKVVRVADDFERF